MHISDTLPDTLHGLLEVALKDFDAFVAAGNQAWMGTWLHEENNVCVGCLAGAVLHQRFGLKHFDPMNNNLPQSLRNKLQTLDFLRAGHIRLASIHLCEKELKTKDRFFYHTYASNPKGWRIEIENLLKELKANGE